MKFFSKSAKLSMDIYTNHSIRSTCISTLDDAGFDARHIIKLSSHKNESSIKEYAQECPERKRKEMFQMFLMPSNPLKFMVKLQGQMKIKMQTTTKLTKLTYWMT